MHSHRNLVMELDRLRINKLFQLVLMSLLKISLQWIQCLQSIKSLEVIILLLVLQEVPHKQSLSSLSKLEVIVVGLRSSLVRILKLIRRKLRNKQTTHLHLRWPPDLIVQILVEGNRLQSMNLWKLIPAPSLNSRSKCEIWESLKKLFFLKIRVTNLIIW